MRIVFMGTPDFAVASLEAIHRSHHTVVAVVTAVDQLGGRGRNQLIESEVKKYAIANNLPVFQPKSLQSSKFISKLEAIDADMFVVVAFRMLPEIVWSMPPKGTINLHGSLLPKYRGAAPINWAIIKGETKTGVTTFFIEKNIDTGAVILQREIDIHIDETMGDVYHKLKMTGAELMLETLDLLESGNYMVKVQDSGESTEAPKINLHTGKITDNMSIIEVHNLVRGLNPYPNAWIKRKDSIIKIIKTRIDPSDQKTIKTDLNTMELVSFQKRLFLKCKDGLLEILELKPEGKKQLKAIDFINGTRDLEVLND